MKFRPCIDIHNGKVKQIVGGSIKDTGNKAVENFVSEKDGEYFASLYKKDCLTGGHIIQLNAAGSEFYNATKENAIKALNAYKKGMQIGGGINAENAAEYIKQGASHVIVTSYVFKDGKVNYDNLKKIENEVGKEHLVLDLSCRKKDNNYMIVTDRWQKYTEVEVTEDTLSLLAEYCDEFLIHAVDVEGKVSGIEEELVKQLGKWNGIPVTYAGGISSEDDIKKLEEYGKEKIDFTIGSALNLFGGKMSYEEIVKKYGR